MGFVRVANETMCRPIRALTQMKGYDVGQHTLACFGGAGGQHACAIARNLGMRRIFVHRYAGVLSAVGIGLADVVAEEQVRGDIPGPSWLFLHAKGSSAGRWRSTSPVCWLGARKRCCTPAGALGAGAERGQHRGAGRAPGRAAGQGQAALAGAGMILKVQALCSGHTAWRLLHACSWLFLLSTGPRAMRPGCKLKARLSCSRRRMAWLSAREQ